MPLLKRLAPYGVAILSVALAAAVRLEMDPLLNESATLLTFAVAVILTSWFGGFWPGLLAVALSLLASDYFFVAPRYSVFRYDSRADEIRAILFAVFGLLFSMIFARLRASIEAERRVRERFQLLVDGVKDYAIFMLDAKGRVSSWNPGAERIKGYQPNEIIGRDFSVFYTLEDVESGKPRRALEIAAAEGRYDESGWQVRRDGSRFWASGVVTASRDRRGELIGFTVITRDVTERKILEEKTRFFSDLNQALAPLSDPEEVMAAAALMLGEHLGADRCAYAEVEPNEKYLRVTNEYARGEIPSVVGRFSVDDLGAEALRMMRANRPYVVDDVEAAYADGRDLSAFRRVGVRALICAPLKKNGHYVARMIVGQKTPRHWEQWEVEIVSKVANRCWESVERARAARNLRESEERYRAFIANSSEAIWRFELEKPIPVNLPEDEQIEMLFKYAYLAECNDAMARMYGYERADQIVGARIGDLLIKSDPLNIAHLRAFKRSGFNLADSESHEVDRYGNEKYFLNNLTGIIENGAVVRAWGTQRDITERKRAEKALRESEERLRRISDATQDSIWEIDLRTNQLWWNERSRPLFGDRPGSLQPSLEDWYDRIHPDDVARVKARFEEFMRNDERNWFDEYRFRRPDGSYVHIFDQGQKFFDESGTPILIAGAMRDITTRVEAEEALRASEERYRLLTEISPDGVVIAGDDGTIHLANQSMQRMLGVEPEQVIGRNLFDFFPPRCVEQYRGCLTELMTCAMPEGQVEIAFRRDDGQVLPAEVSAVRFDWKGRRFAQYIIHDISGRKRAEIERERLREEIEAERNRLWQILEQMPVGVIVAEAPSGRLLFCSREAESLLRHPLPCSDDIEGYTRWGGLHKDGRRYEAREYPLARSIISGEVINGEEIRYRRGDGTETFLSVDSAPITDAEGRRVLAVATFIDIAERKRAEEALRESEERFAKAFRASPDGLAITRRSDGVILEVNDSWRQMLGYGSDEVIGKRWVQFDFPLDPADRRRVRAIMEEQGYIRNYEMAVRRKSGEPLIARISIEPIELRGEQCLVTFVHDITQRKRAEEALRKSEEQARRQLAYVEAIYATAPVGLCFVDTDLRYLSINERLAEINGKSVDEHLGRKVREVIPEIADQIEAVCRRVIESGEPALQIDQSFESKSEPGAVRHFITSFYPIKNGGGSVLGVNIVVMEITERKKIEEELERLLRQEKAAREEAEAASRMKDEFLATISHELRTPLTSILGWARMLTSGGLTMPQARHALEVIAQSAQSQNKLIEDILDTSRIITGRLKLEAQPVAIEHIFHSAVDVVRPSAEAKEIALSEIVEAPDGVVFGDANRLQQAVWNLLSNAVKFTGAGGRIEARLGRVNGQIEITVTDTGIGIDPKFLPHVFDRFRQADASSTREYGGLGIGLAIVRHIVEMHGGGVSASSPGKGQGATFKIRLPMISVRRMAPREGSPPAAPGAIERKTPGNGHRLDGVRVLLVEDNPDTLDMLRFIFDESGAEVIAATSVDEALDALDRFSPDALVSDIAIPERDGYDLIREVRAREPERGGKIPAVAVTAYARAEDRVRALAAGFQMHVAKPIDPDELIAVVASLTGHIHY